MVKNVILLDPLTAAKSGWGHRHLLRDWTGAYLPGLVPFPPLDLMYAAAYLRDHGHRVDVIEASVKHYSSQRLVQLIASRPVDFVVLPTTFFSLDEDKKLSAAIRAAVPGVRIIFTGPSVTGSPQLVLEDGSADFVALGEVELPLLAILSGNYGRNVAYKDGDKIVCGERDLLDLAKLPIPARDLFDNQAYRYAIFNRKNPVTAMTISRGCPHSKCIFCYSHLYGLGNIRYRPIGSILAEIDEVVFKYKIGEIFFRDQAFTANRELVLALCDYLISRKIAIPWRATTRVDLVDIDLLRRMKLAGCYQLSFGFETCSQSVLDMNQKGITIEQSRRAARMCKEAGIEMLGLFMFGMLGDSLENMRDLAKFIIQLDVDFVQIDSVYFIPGSPLYAQYTRKDLLPLNVVSRYIFSAYCRFYLRPRYLLKQFKRVSSVRDLVFLIRTGFNIVFPGL